MQFFIPQTLKRQQEEEYQSIIAQMTDQLRWPVTQRRIFRLEYIHDKKSLAVEVGKLEQLENRYKVLAILESSVYIVFTKAMGEDHGVTILINKDEVTSVTNFD